MSEEREERKNRPRCGAGNAQDRFRPLKGRMQGSGRPLSVAAILNLPSPPPQSFLQLVLAPFCEMDYVPPPIRIIPWLSSGFRLRSNPLSVARVV